MFLRRFLLGVILIFAFAGATASALEKWVYYPVNLLVEKNLETLETVWRRAAKAGYTHVLLADSKFSRLEEMDPRYFRNVERVKKLAAELKLEIVPAVFPVGYSNDILSRDVNLIEALPVRDLPMVVEKGEARVAEAAPPLPGGDCSDLKKWSWADPVWKVDNGAAHCEGKEGLARIVQKLKLRPYTQYHLALRVKTHDFKTPLEVKVLPATGTSLTWSNLGVKATQDWKEHHVVFNSFGNSEASLYVGVWGLSGGSVWVDDVKLETVAFLNMPRRPGTPLAIKTAEGKALVEGTDFEPLKDPLFGMKPWPGEYDIYHEPPKLRTKLPDGTKLLASYFHGVTVYDGQVMICPSEPKTMQVLRDQAKRVHAAWGAKGYMMSHDEIRVLNWCDACQKRKLTPGKIIAENAKECVAILREVNPGGRIYVWNDMFDPHHNAVKKNYYLVNGDLTGSWEGLDKGVTIVPWYFEKRAESLKFFADRGHKQVIAGYYDAKPERVAQWLEAAKAVPGSVQGVMYTTWRNDYSNLERFSEVMDRVGK